MSDATTLLDPKDAAARQPALRALLAHDLPITASRAEVIVWVARQVVGRSDYKFGGRGGYTLNSLTFDEFGFVRFCVSAARRWTPGVGQARPETGTLDLLVDESLSYIRCVDALKAWGLERLPVQHPFPYLPGDIVVSVGPGPCLTIVTAAATHDRPALFAGIWPDETVTEGPYRDWSKRPPGQLWRMLATAEREAI